MKNLSLTLLVLFVGCTVDNAVSPTNYIEEIEVVKEVEFRQIAGDTLAYYTENDTSTYIFSGEIYGTKYFKTDRAYTAYMKENGLTIFEAEIHFSWTQSNDSVFVNHSNMTEVGSNLWESSMFLNDTLVIDDI